MSGGIYAHQWVHERDESAKPIGFASGLLCQFGEPAVEIYLLGWTHEVRNTVLQA